MSTLRGRGIVGSGRGGNQLTGCIAHDADLLAVEHSFGFAIHLKLCFKTMSAGRDMQFFASTGTIMLIMGIR
ncbi:hypothetical protein ACOTHJ_15530 [Achromobacter xylosoxidans]